MHRASIAIIIVTAIGLAGIFGIAASRADDPAPSCNAPVISPYGEFKQAFGEDGEPVECLP